MTSNHFIPFRYTRMLGYSDALGCALICSDIFGCSLIYSDASRPSQRVPLYSDTLRFIRVLRRPRFIPICSDALQYIPMRSVPFRSLRLLPVVVGVGIAQKVAVKLLRLPYFSVMATLSATLFLLKFQRLRRMVAVVAVLFTTFLYILHFTTLLPCY